MHSLRPAWSVVSALGSGPRRLLPRRTIHTSLSVIDSLKVGVGAAEKHSMGHTPLPQRMTPRRVDG